jgi:uncharacterized protein YbaR (Trm112 family)
LRRPLLEILACPVCKHHPLTLHVKEEDLDGIVRGTLTCSRCAIDYPIIDGIPDLIPSCPDDER